MSTEEVLGPKEEVLDFPAKISVRVMGKNDPALEALVRQTADQMIPAADFISLKTNPSRNGNFLAVVLTANFPSRQAVDDFYCALSGHPLVTMML